MGDNWSKDSHGGKEVFESLFLGFSCMMNIFARKAVENCLAFNASWNRCSRSSKVDAKSLLGEYIKGKLKL